MPAPLFKARRRFRKGMMVLTVRSTAEDAFYKRGLPSNAIIEMAISRDTPKAKVREYLNNLVALAAIKYQEQADEQRK